MSTNENTPPRTPRTPREETPPQTPRTPREKTPPRTPRTPRTPREENTPQTPRTPREENTPPAETAAWFLAQPAAFHENWMDMALAEARAAAAEGEVPMGCVVVRREPGGSARAIARARNRVESLKDPTAHAERLAIAQAAEAAGDWRLPDCALYVTKEPCPMCGGAIVLARLALVVWAASDPKRGAHTVFGLFSHPGLNHHPAVMPACGPAAALAELQSFFKSRRAPRSC